MEVLGKGMAVLPDEGKIVAPCEAKVTTLFDTKHAIGLITKDGVELLIHMNQYRILTTSYFFFCFYHTFDKRDLIVNFIICIIYLKCWI